MARWAVVNNGIVINIVVADAAQVDASVNIWIDITNVNPKPGISWKYDGVTFISPVKQVDPPVVYTAMSVSAFWDRWQQSERINFDVASQHNPADTNQQKQDAAKLRLFKQDIAEATRVKPANNKVRNIMTALETNGILAVGRASAILDAPITSAEAA